MTNYSSQLEAVEPATEVESPALDAALDLLDRDLSITLCPPLRRNPIGEKWTDRYVGKDWPNKRWTPDEVREAFEAKGNCNVGLLLGPPSRIIDIEIDGGGGDGVLAELFDGDINDSAMHWMAIDREGKFAESPENFGEWFGRLTPKGEKPTLITSSDFPCAIGADGNLYFAKMHGLDIIRRTPEGRESVFVSRQDFNLAPDSHFGVNGIATGRDGAIYVVALDSVNRLVGTGDHVLHSINSAGEIRQLAKNFVTDKLPEDKQHPEVRPEYCRGMAVDDDKNVYVAVTGNRSVMKISPDGKSSVVLDCEPPWSPTGVAVLRGEVYVLEYDDETPTEGRNWPPRVRKVDRKGQVTTLAEIKRDE